MTREPECRCAMNTDAHTDGHCDWCICNRLRAAYRRGVTEARAAVSALDDCPECSVDAALAAIDALAVDA